ncbi:MAG: hypothetical protein SNJ55_05495 [Chloroherpetonaceae bacterium]
MKKNFSLRAVFALLVALSLTISTRAQEQSSSALLAPPKTQRDLGGGFARELALGAGGAYNPNGLYNFNPFLRNDTYLLINPAYIGDFGNYVWGNFDGAQSGATSQTFAGANFEVTKNLYLGLLVNTRDALATTGLFNVFGDTLSDIENTLGFLIGYKLSPELTLGAQIYTGSRTAEQKSEASNGTSTKTSKLSVLGLDFGAVYNTAQLRGELAVRVRMNSRSTKTQPASGQSSEFGLDGGMELGVNARAFYKLNSTYDLVPTFSFYNVSTKIKNDPPPPPNSEAEEFSQSAFEVGLGLNAKTKNALLIGGISFVSATEEAKTTNLGGNAGDTRTETDKTTLLPRLNLGLEYYALDWLTVRLGYFKTMGGTESIIEQRVGNNTTKNTTTRNGFSSPNYLGDFISVGVGMHFGEWNMNFAVNETFLRNGPNFVGGNTTSPLFAVFSSSYRF